MSTQVTIPCEMCGSRSWLLFLDQETETYHLRCRRCDSIGPFVTLET